MSLLPVLLRPGDEAQAKGLLQSLAEFTGVSELELRGNPRYFEEFNMDSLDVVELATELEDEFSG